MTLAISEDARSTEELCQLIIEAAFGQVELEDGIGLSQASGIDVYSLIGSVAGKYLHFVVLRDFRKAARCVW